MTGRRFPRTLGEWCSEFHCLSQDRYSYSDSVALEQFTQLQGLSCTQIGWILYTHAQRWTKGSRYRPVWFFIQIATLGTSSPLHGAKRCCTEARHSSQAMPSRAVLPSRFLHCCCRWQGVSHQPSKASSCGDLPEHLQEGSKSQEPLLCPDLLMGRMLSKGKQWLPALILVIHWSLHFLSFEHSPAVTEKSLSRNCYLEIWEPGCHVKEKLNAVPLSAVIEKCLKSLLRSW